jgi:hypothetical protein
MAIALSQVCVDRSALETGLDDAIFTLHWDLAALDHASRDAATTKLKTFWAAAAPSIGTQHVFREVKWYDVNAAAPRTVFKETILAAAAPGIAGGSAGLVLPTQDACSITLKTVPRRHWGRFYLPGFTGTQMDDSSHRGHWKPALCDTLAAAAKVLCSGPGSNLPVVYSQPLHVTYGITEVQVDDVPDIIRRRRAKKAIYKKSVATT